MQNSTELETLRKKVETLEARNRELEQRPRRDKRGRARSVIAGVLIVLSVILAPAAAIGSWAAAQLADTDRFVATFAPLAEDEALQQFAAAQAMQAIEASVDIDGLVAEVFDGLGELDLPRSAQQLLPLLVGPTAEGLRSVMASSIETLVSSPAFAQIWEATLRETHSHAIAIIQGDPNAMLQLTENGTISLSLANVVGEVRQLLIAQGFGFAEQIPEVDRMIPIFTSDSLLLVRALYQLATALGFWLPWLVLGLFVLGVAIAHNRMRALMWGSIGLALSFLLLALGIGVGKQAFVFSVSPSIMPADAATALFAQLTLLISSTLAALVALSIVVAVGAWLAAGSRPARAVRRTVDSMVGSARGSLGRHGLRTGAFGRALERWHPTITIATLALGIAVLFLLRPITTSGVIITVIVVLIVLLVLQLLRTGGDHLDERRADAAPGTPDEARGASVQ